MYGRLKVRGIPVHVADHTVSIGVYFSDPDGNGLEVYYELPRSRWNRRAAVRRFDRGREGPLTSPWDEILRPAAAARGGGR